MNYHKIEKTSIVNGEGIRVVLWCSGCGIRCKGCHNPETWELKSGKPFDDEARKALYDAVNKPYIKGITLSGGHPLEDENLPEVFAIIAYIKENFPDKDIWLYPGWTLNADDFTKSTTFDNSLVNQILVMCDVVVDGRYIEGLRDITLRFRGSLNQRIIDVKKTIASNDIVLWNGGKYDDISQ